MEFLKSNSPLKTKVEWLNSDYKSLYNILTTFIDCPQLEEISNGNIKCTNRNKVGSKCTYSCDPGE